MTKLSIFLVAVGISSVAIANATRIEPYQTAMPVLCMDAKTLFEMLQREYDEVPVMMAKTQETVDITDANITVWVSEKERTVSVVATIGDEACLLSSAKDVVISREFRYN